MLINKSIVKVTMKQKIKTQSQPAWQVTYVTPDGKQGTFKSSDAMLKSHKMLLQGNSCIKSFNIKPLV